MIRGISFNVLFLIAGIVFFSACSSQDKNDKEVVVYTSVDQIFSSQILKELEQKSGIKIRVVYDTEASKAVGLEKRLLKEKAHPKADIFWNSENLRTARLDKAGLFQKQAKHTYVAMGLRSRVFVVNTKKMKESEFPGSLEELTDPKYKGKVAISNPLFGTASAQFAALLAKWGEERFINFLQALKNNDVAILAGNANVKNRVGFGEFFFGLVDTDDALVGISQGLPLKMIYYDQDKEGVYGVYGTLAIMKNAPHPQEAQKLLKHLYNKEVEKQLIAMNAVQFGLLFDDENKKHIKMWIPPAEETSSYLKHSAELIREYLD